MTTLIFGWTNPLKAYFESSQEHPRRLWAYVVIYSIRLCRSDCGFMNTWRLQLNSWKGCMAGVRWNGNLYSFSPSIGTPGAWGLNYHLCQSWRREWFYVYRTWPLTFGQAIRGWEGDFSRESHQGKICYWNMWKDMILWPIVARLTFILQLHFTFFWRKCKCFFLLKTKQNPTTITHCHNWWEWFLVPMVIWEF